MPDVASDKTFEADNNSCDHSGIGSHRVFPARLVRVGRHRRTRVLQDASVFIEKGFETAPVENLESHQMKMDRVGVVRQVNQVPDFHRVQGRILRNRHIPMSAIEQHRDRVLSPVIYFDER